MGFGTHWTKYLGAGLLLSQQEIDRLEKLRREEGIDNRTFFEVVRTSPARLLRICDYYAHEIRKVNPVVDPTEILRLTYVVSHLNNCVPSGVNVSVVPDKLAKQVVRYAPHITERSYRAAMCFARMQDVVSYLMTEPEFEQFTPKARHKIQERVDQALGWHGSSLHSGSTDDPLGPTRGWLAGIPPELRPNDSQTSALEALRTRAKVPNDTFSGWVMQSPGTTRVLLRRQYAALKAEQPGATNADIFHELAQQWYYRTDRLHGASHEEALEYMGSGLAQSIIQDALTRVSNLDDLARYIVEEYEDFWSHKSDSSGIQSQIAEILGYRR